MHSLQSIGPRLGRSIAAFSGTAKRWKRRTYTTDALQALLGLEPNQPSPAADSPSTDASTFPGQLRHSHGALLRHETKAEDLIDTLRTALDNTKPLKKRKKKAKKHEVKEQVSAPSTPAENPAKYDMTSELKDERWLDDWGEDKLAPPHLEPAYIRRLTIPYKRRVEGLLEDEKELTPLTDLDPVSEHHPVASLAHGLDRVLFNPGVHWLQDPRSHVYNFTPWLENIPKVNDFAFERLIGFITSSKDDDLWTLARRENRTFTGSTSSLTKILSHIYFLISGDKEVDTSTLSHAFQREPRTFTPGQRMPASVVLHYRDGVYAFDSDSDSSEKADRNILSWLGTLLEKFLTSDPQRFEQYLRSNPPLSDQSPKREAYRYAKSERFVMRSQLDCHDPRLPGTGVFDIKTRAALPIRLDMLNYEENSGYLIRTLQGPLESFEKEYYDLIRSAFLKYNFQARIGNMDGVLVAYHNTARLFGFQYVPLEEMDQRLFGSADAGPRIFQKCLALMEIISNEVIKSYPDQSVECLFETLEGKEKMNIWIQPLNANMTAAEENNNESDRPSPVMKQLEVTAINYVSDCPTRGQDAVTSSKDAEWSIYWTISTLANSRADILREYEAAKDRQFRSYLLPSGVGKQDVQELWDKLNFRKATTAAVTSSDGSKISEVATSQAADPDISTDAAQVESTVNPDHFTKPSRNIKFLRSVARAGRQHTQMVAEQRKGKPRIVWGEAMPWVDETSTMDTSPSPDGTDGPEIDEADVPGVEVAAETPDAVSETFQEGFESAVVETGDMSTEAYGAQAEISLADEGTDGIRVPTGVGFDVDLSGVETTEEDGPTIDGEADASLSSGLADANLYSLPSHQDGITSPSLDGAPAPPSDPLGDVEVDTRPYAYALHFDRSVEEAAKQETRNSQPPSSWELDTSADMGLPDEMGVQDARSSEGIRDPVPPIQPASPPAPNIP